MKKAEVVARVGTVAADIIGDIQRNQIAKGEPTPAAAAPEPNADAKPEPKKKKGKKPLRVETVLVRHDFSTEELAGLGQKLADEERLAEGIESEMKTCARQYKDKLTTSHTKIDGIVDKLKEGFEMVAVEAVVMVKIDRKEKTARKCYYRKDTGQFIRDEDAVNAELELFNVLPDGRDLKKALPAKLLNSQV